MLLLCWSSRHATGCAGCPGHAPQPVRHVRRRLLGAFICAFAGFGNFGILARQRVLMLPFFLILLALPREQETCPRKRPKGRSKVLGADGARVTRTVAAAPTGLRARLKHALAIGRPGAPASGATLLIYHRVGGGTSDELDVRARLRQARWTCCVATTSSPSTRARPARGGGHPPQRGPHLRRRVRGRLPNAWPLLGHGGCRSRCISPRATWVRRWCGRGRPPGERRPGHVLAPAGRDGRLGPLHRREPHPPHVGPESLSEEELDLCTSTVERQLGVTPRHFTYPWGVRVDHGAGAAGAVPERLHRGDSGATARHADRMRFARVPVRQSDPSGSSPPSSRQPAVRACVCRAGAHREGGRPARLTRTLQVRRGRTTEVYHRPARHRSPDVVVGRALPSRFTHAGAQARRPAQP